jgi:hypothetical protein
VGEFPELLGYSSSELNSNDRSSELVYSGIAPGLALDLMGIRSSYVLHIIDDRAIDGQMLTEVLAGKKDFSLRGVVGERRFFRRVVFDGAAPCPPVFSAALREAQNARDSREEFLGRRLPALLVRGSGLCGGSQDASGGVARVLKDAPDLPKRFRELDCSEDSITIEISHSEPNDLLALLSARIVLEKTFCSASSMQKKNDFAFLDNSPVYDVIKIKLCKPEEGGRPWSRPDGPPSLPVPPPLPAVPRVPGQELIPADRPHSQFPRVSAVALADTLSGVLGEDLLAVGWTPLFGGSKIDRDLPFRLEFEQDRFGRRARELPESENVRMIGARLSLTSGSKTSPRLITAVLDGLAIEGVHFSSFRLGSVRDLDLYAAFSFASTESDEALAALNKDRSVKIK